MSAENSNSEIYLEYFKTYKLFNYIANILPLLFSHIKGERVIKNFSEKDVIEYVNDMAKDLRIDFNHSEFEELLLCQIKSFESGNILSNDLREYVKGYWEKIKMMIYDIPNSQDKAQNVLLGLIGANGFDENDQTLDAMVFLSHYIEPQKIRDIIIEWKKEAHRYSEDKEKGKITYPGTGGIFWTSRDFMEIIDAISRYRFREHFDIGEFQSAFQEVEVMAAGALMDGFGGVESVLDSCSGVDNHLYGATYDLWLISRSRDLPNKLRQLIEIALQRISAWQHREGWWPEFRIQDKENLMNTYATALCALCLLKLSNTQTLREKGILAAKWLLEKQNPDGSWSEERIEEGVISKQPDIATTLLSLEVILRSGIDSVNHTIDMGIDWIMKQQNNLGLWEEDAFPFPFLTVIVMEFLKNRHLGFRKMDGYMDLGKYLLDRSIEFSLVDDHNRRRSLILPPLCSIKGALSFP